MAFFFKPTAKDAPPSKPAGGRVVGAAVLLLALFGAALIVKNNVAWEAPAETLVACFEILFTAVVALFGFEGAKYLV